MSRRAPAPAQDTPAQAATLTRALVVIRDADDAQYDLYALAPPGMPLSEASYLVDTTIASIRNGDTMDCGSDALEVGLEDLGFEWPATGDATYSW